MKRRTVSLVLLGTVLVPTAWFVWGRGGRDRIDRPFQPSETPGAVIPVADYRFSGPYWHDNLVVFLVHGPATVDGRSFLTLQEALETGQAVLHETGTVNRLEIENRSGDHELFVQSGDVVKGGKQDRTLPYDTVVPVSSGRIPIDSFCVEQGRWTRREGESSSSFSSSPVNLPTNSLKRAAYAPREASQGAVWHNVAVTQDRLEKKLGQSVKASASGSSLQLTLESQAVTAAVDPYLNALRTVPDGRGDVIGYVVTINGRVISADVYASPRLFRKLWPKLLQGSSVEAVIEAEPGHSFEPVTEAAVRSFLAEAERGTVNAEGATERSYVQSRQTDRLLLVESCDRSRGNVVLHRSFLLRTDD